MTAEFDSSGFSAVAKFFGNDASKETTTGAKRSTASNNASSRGKRRGGVGAHTRSSSKQLPSDLLSKKVLTVGRKRNRENDDVDEGEAYEGTGLDDHGIDGGDDEVDGGRTSIVKKKTVTSKKADPGPTGNNKKTKKKLGKKERQRQKEMEDTAAMDVFEPAPEGKDRSGSNDVKTKGASGNETMVADPKNGESGTNPKKKRKKVRSRQKNIRKDNRSSEEKPAHLIPGSRNYQGRPMTQETRDKLNLPPSNKNRNRNFSKPQADGGNDDLFVIDRNPDTGGEDDLGVQLAIDGFLSGNNDKAEEKKEGQDTEMKATSKKKKKKRFKNLY